MPLAPPLITILAFALGGLVFAIFPSLDLTVTGLFYDPVTQSFPLDHYLNPVSDTVQALFKAMPWILLLLLVVSFVFKGKRFVPQSRAMVFVTLVVIVGPGLIVNELLKNNFGRARPMTVEQFGGDRHFSPALVMTDQCERNCSFVCGDAAGGFAFLAFALLATRRRKVYVVAAVGLGVLLGIVRIMQGAHFTSDVLFAGTVTLSVVYGLYWLVMDRDSSSAKR